MNNIVKPTIITPNHICPQCGAIYNTLAALCPECLRKYETKGKRK